MTDYRTTSVPVSGGQLAVGTWNSDATHATQLLAIHGITASHLAWPLVADRLAGTRVIAPDLRGRARSNSLPPPWGIRNHADDMAAVLDGFGVERVVVVGHSMGGFVAVRFAAQHPDRVASLVLVDGGLPLPTLQGVPDRELPARLLGPAGERLSRVFPNRESYESSWRSHPAFVGHWSRAVGDYADYDLDEVPGGFRPSSNYDAIAANIVQLSGDDGYREALAGLTVPVTFLRAPRGLLNEEPPLNPPEVVHAAQRLAPQLTVFDAHDVNHYTIVMAPEGAEQVARLVRPALSAAAEDRHALPPRISGR